MEKWTHQVTGGRREGVALGDSGWAHVIGKQRTERARLIAAAPDLLEALKNLTATARTFRNVPVNEQEWTPIDDDALDAAFAAIAKAEEVEG